MNLLESASLNSSLSAYNEECFLIRDNVYAFLIILLTLLMVVFLGNSFLILSVCKFPHMRRTSYILIANLSISNYLLVLNIALGVAERNRFLSPTEKRYLCLSKSATFTAAFVASEYNLLLISIERFLAICFPFWHKTAVRKKRLGIIIVVCWVFYVILAFCPLFGWNSYSDGDHCLLSVIWSIEYFCIIGSVVFLGLVLNTILFMTVLYEIKCKRMPAHAKLYSKTTWISFLIITGFVVCWCPFLLATFLAEFWRKKSAIFPCAYEAMVFIGAMNGLVNFCIYGLCNAKFRSAIKAILTNQNLSESQ